jgi:hypothetical protein
MVKVVAIYRCGCQVVAVGGKTSGPFESAKSSSAPCSKHANCVKQGRGDLGLATEHALLLIGTAFSWAGGRRGFRRNEDPFYPGANYSS